VLGGARWTVHRGSLIARVNTELGATQIAVVDEEPAAAAKAAERLREAVKTVSTVP
jgi:hypothetical protein